MIFRYNSINWELANTFALGVILLSMLANVGFDGLMIMQKNNTMKVNNRIEKINNTKLRMLVSLLLNE